MAYIIETLTPDGWTDDTSLLRHCYGTQVLNGWPTEAEAQAAVAELVELGFIADRMRVVPAPHAT